MKNIAKQKITPFLWFDGQAEEAMNFYISVFKNKVFTFNYMNIFCMKNRIVFLSCGAVVLAMFAFWNGEVTAQPNPGGDGRGSELPMNLKCIVTLDAQSNSRATMTQEMQMQSGIDWVHSTIRAVQWTHLLSKLYAVTWARRMTSPSSSQDVNGLKVRKAAKSCRLH